MSKERIQRNFLANNLSSRIKCPICYDVFFKPRRLFCGHSFCKPCLKELRRNHDNVERELNCPLCREVIDPNKVTHDLVAQKMINELQVTCPIPGCIWKGQNQFLETHYRFDCAMRDKLSMGSQKTSKISSSMSINIISSDEEIPQQEEGSYEYGDEGDQDGSEIQFNFSQRICAQEYGYREIKPVEGNKIFVISRGVQTYDFSSPQPPPPVPQKRRRRRRRKSMQSNSQRPRIRRRRRCRSKKNSQPKIQQNVSTKSKVSRAQQMKDIENLYEKMGFDFYASYEQAEKKVKPIVVNVDAPRHIMKQKQW